MAWGHCWDGSGTLLGWPGDTAGMAWGHCWDGSGTLLGWPGDTAGMARGQMKPDGMAWGPTT